MRRPVARTLAAALLSVIAVAAASAQTRPAAPVVSFPPAGALPGGDDYRIGPDDMLTIVVWKDESLSRLVIVRPDGKISLPLVNDVTAAGLTAMQLRAELTRRLGEFVVSPEVAVVVDDARSLKVSVLGQVRRPGRYELRTRTTVLDGLALAGGFTERAVPKGIVILRRDGDGVKRIPFDYERVMTGAEEPANFDLAPNDIILVP